MYSKELIKGTLSTIILKLLASHGKMYGYEITQRVKLLSDEKILIKEGSLYPALHKLKDDGLVQAEKETIDNRVRKYYSLTTKGQELAESKVSELNQFIATIQNILVAKPSTS